MGFREDRQRPLRVATKYPAIARRFYAAQSREIEIIKLNGSIELAPLLGLSDVIVDIVETGTTLRQNNLEVTREILPISARFIANKAAMKFKEPAISRRARGRRDVTQAVEAIVEDVRLRGDEAVLDCCGEIRRCAARRPSGA